MRWPREIGHLTRCRTALYYNNPDRSLPDALGRPVDHGGGGRRLPSERTGDEAEVGGHAEAAGIPEDEQLHGSQRGFAGAYLGRDLEHGSAGIPQRAMETL